MRKLYIGPLNGSSRDTRFNLSCSDNLSIDVESESNGNVARLIPSPFSPFHMHLWEQEWPIPLQDLGTDTNLCLVSY
jgi:hypothetical protein